jgi:hypothetical protein
VRSPSWIGWPLWPYDQTLNTTQKTLHSKHYTQNTTQKTNSRLNDTNLTKTMKSISGTLTIPLESSNSSHSLCDLHHELVDRYDHMTTNMFRLSQTQFLTAFLFHDSSPKCNTTDVTSGPGTASSSEVPEIDFIVLQRPNKNKRKTTIHKTKDRVKKKNLITEDELRCSGRV